MLDVGLVRRVDVHVVFARTRHVQVLVSNFGVHSEMEFRVLSSRFFSVVRVFEVKVSRNVVFVWSRLVNVCVVGLTFASSNCNGLAYVSQMVGVIFIGSDWLLNQRSSLLVSPLSCNGLGWLDDESRSVM